MLVVLAAAGGRRGSHLVRCGSTTPLRRSVDLHPRKQSRVTTIYAADGSQLGVIHSETIREPVAGDRITPWLKDAHGRDRGQELLQRGRDRSAGDHPCRVARSAGRRQAAAGRLDDHAAAGPQPLHLATARDDPPQDHRGASRQRGERQPLEGLDPHRVPEHGALRHQPRRDRARRAGRRRDLLLALGEAADVAPGGDDRRAAAGAVAVQPAAASDTGRWSAATRCCERC